MKPCLDNFRWTQSSNWKRWYVHEEAVKEQQVALKQDKDGEGSVRTEIDRKPNKPTIKTALGADTGFMLGGGGILGAGCSFLASKAELSKPTVLALYNPESETKLSSDASSYGCAMCLMTYMCVSYVP